jgi:hypothetical protein
MRLQPIKYKGNKIVIDKLSKGKGYDWKITTKLGGKTYLKQEGRAFVENRKQVVGIAKDVINHPEDY